MHRLRWCLPIVVLCGGAAAVVILNARTPPAPGARVLTTLPRDPTAREPEWDLVDVAPEQDQLLLRRVDGSRRRSLWAWRVGSGDLRQIPLPALPTGAQWRPLGYGETGASVLLLKWPGNQLHEGDAQSGSVVPLFSAPSGATTECVAVSPDGSRAAIWVDQADSKTGKMLSRLFVGAVSTRDWVEVEHSLGPGRLVRHCSWSPDGRSLAVGTTTPPSAARHYRLLSLASGETRYLPKHRYVCWLSNGRHLTGSGGWSRDPREGVELVVDQRKRHVALPPFGRTWLLRATRTGPYIVAVRGASPTENWVLVERYYVPGYIEGTPTSFRRLRSIANTINNRAQRSGSPLLWTPAEAWLVSPDGRHTHRLPVAPEQWSTCAWSRDGRTLYFLCGHVLHRCEVPRMPTAARGE